MKYNFLFFYLLVATHSLHAPPILIDETIAIVYNPTGNDVIKLSDLNAGLDGEPRQFREIVEEKLALAEARKYQINVPDEEIDKFLSELQKNYRWTRDMLITEFENLGFSYQEGRDLIKDRRMVNQLLQFKVDVDVSDEEITQEYNKNTPHEQAKITLEFAYVPFTQYTAVQLDAYLSEQKIPDDIRFEESETYKTNQLADEHVAIASKPVNTVMLTIREEDGYVLARLAEKIDPRPLPLSECYTSISNLLRQKKFESQLKNFYKELISNAHIVILNPQFSL